MLPTLLLLLPLAAAAPTPQGFSDGLIAPVIGCNSRICDPLGVDLDLSKGPLNPSFSSYAGVRPIKLASTRPVELEADTEVSGRGSILVRLYNGIIKSKKAWIPDLEGLVKDESKKQSKRALEALSVDQWTFVSSVTGALNSVIKCAYQKANIVNDKNIGVDSKEKRDTGTEIGNGIMVGVKEKRDPKPFAGTVGGGGGIPPNKSSAVKQGGDVTGNGFVIGSKMKIKRNGAERPYWGTGNDGAIKKSSIIGASDFIDGAADSEDHNREIIDFSDEMENEKRSDISESVEVRSGSNTIYVNMEGDAERSDVSERDRDRSGSNTSFWNSEGNSKRSGVSIGNQVEKEESTGDAVFTDWTW